MFEKFIRWAPSVDDLLLSFVVMTELLIILLFASNIVLFLLFRKPHKQTSQRKTFKRPSNVISLNVSKDTGNVNPEQQSLPNHPLVNLASYFNDGIYPVHLDNTNIPFESYVLNTRMSPQYRDPQIERIGRIQSTPVIKPHLHVYNNPYMANDPPCYMFDTSGYLYASGYCYSPEWETCVDANIPTTEIPIQARIHQQANIHGGATTLYGGSQNKLVSNELGNAEISEQMPAGTVSNQNNVPPTYMYAFYVF